MIQSTTAANTHAFGSVDTCQEQQGKSVQHLGKHDKQAISSNCDSNFELHKKTTKSATGAAKGTETPLRQ